MEKKYPLKLNSDYCVVTANDLIKGRQKMTLREAQLLFITISQVVKKDKDFKTYTTTVPELAGFMKIDENSLYRDLENICTNLCQRVVKIKVRGDNTKKNKWKIFQWVNSASYDNGILTLRLSDDIKPFLIDLDKYYTQITLGVLLSFKSYYATRLYQYLIADVGLKGGDIEEWKFTCEEIRELFQVNDKNSKGEYKEYKLSRNLVDNTIIPALIELNASPLCYVYDYEEKKAHSRGTPLLGVSFKAIFFDEPKRKEFFLKYSKPKIEERQGKPFKEFPTEKKRSVKKKTTKEEK